MISDVIVIPGSSNSGCSQADENVDFEVDGVTNLYKFSNKHLLVGPGCEGEFEVCLTGTIYRGYSSFWSEYEFYFIE